LGILVFGAEKVEEEAEYLKRNLLTATKRVMVSANPHTRSTWKSAKRVLEATGTHVNPLKRRIESFQAKLGHRTEMLVPRIEIRMRKALAAIIDNMIGLLEKVERRLDRSVG
jgi:hypothetical protein